MGSWEITEINVRDWWWEKSIILLFSTVRSLGVDLGSDKEIKMKLRNRKLDKLIYALRRYFWFIINVVVG